MIRQVRPQYMQTQLHAVSCRFGRRIMRVIDHASLILWRSATTYALIFFSEPAQISAPHVAYTDGLSRCFANVGLQRIPLHVLLSLCPLSVRVVLKNTDSRLPPEGVTSVPNFRCWVKAAGRSCDAVVSVVSSFTCKTIIDSKGHFNVLLTAFSR